MNKMNEWLKCDSQGSRRFELSSDLAIHKVWCKFLLIELGAEVRVELPNL
jgi:hypothetical protein